MDEVMEPARVGAVVEDYSATYDAILMSGTEAFRPEAIVYVPRTGESLLLKRRLGPTLDGFVVERGVGPRDAHPLVDGDPLLVIGYTEEADTEGIPWAASPEEATG